MRRGKKTDAVFAQAVRAMRYFISSDPKTGREIQTKSSISPNGAKKLFDENKRASLIQRADGVFVFVIGSPIGYERIEIEIG